MTDTHALAGMGYRPEPTILDRQPTPRLFTRLTIGPLARAQLTFWNEHERREGCEILAHVALGHGQ